MLSGNVKIGLGPGRVAVRWLSDLIEWEATRHTVPRTAEAA